jgi:membrane protein implicated in regulation of membrane protease activity
MKNSIIAGLIFLAAVALLLGVLHYFEILALIALVIGFGVLIGIIIFVVVSGIVLILAVPYYLIAKEPKIDTYGSYTLEDVRSKGEEREEEEEGVKKKE